MNIQDVIKVCGELPQTPASITNAVKKSNLAPIIGLLALAGISYLIYREWKSSTDLEKKMASIKTKNVKI